MVAKLNTYDIAEKEWQKNSDVSFRFGEKDTLQPAGFSSLGPDKDVTVILTGRVSNFSSGAEWEKNKRFTLTMTSCEIIAPAPSATTLDDAIAAAVPARKRVGK